LHEKFSDPTFDREDETNLALPLVINQTMKRNIRCSLAYLSTRLDRLHRVGWESGKSMPDHIKEKISPEEHDYYKQYLAMLDEYGQSCSGAGEGSALGHNANSFVDLTIDLTPPKELFIEVRIKQDYGSIMLPESGEVLLQKNTTHVLRRSEVDHLIKQGIVAEVV